MRKRAAATEVAGGEGVRAQGDRNKKEMIRILGAAALLVVAGVAVYLNSFSGTFLFDDYDSILPNITLQKLWPLSNSLLPPDDSTLRDRPLVNFTLALNFLLSGFDPGSYHFINLLIHLFSALVLFGAVRRTLGGPPLGPRYGNSALGLAFAIALVWLVHPLQTESVTYIIQRSESLCGLFYLLTLYSFIRAAGSSHRLKWYGAAVTASALGMGTKAVMVTAPLMVLAYDILFISRSAGRALKERGGFYFSLAFTWLIQLGLVATSSYPDIRTYQPREYFFSQFGVVVHYLRLAVWPHPLCLDYGWPVARGIGQILPPAILIGGLVVLTAWAFLRKLKPAFFGVWFFLILAPSSSILPLEDLAFEHRMYLPLAGVVSPIVLGVYELLGKIKRNRFRTTLGFFLLITAAIALGGFTVGRNRDYASPVAIWSSVVAQRPGNARTHCNLGLALAEEGRGEEAVEHYRRALELQPDLKEAHANLIHCLTEAGRFEEAVGFYRRLLQMNPEDAQIHYNLAVALLKEGERREAIEYFRSALELRPAYAEAHLNLGSALYQQRMLKEAQVHFERALKINPLYAKAHYNLALILLEKGQAEMARKHLEAVLKLQPDFLPARKVLQELEEKDSGLREESGGDDGDRVLLPGRAPRINPAGVFGG